MSVLQIQVNSEVKLEVFIERLNIFSCHVVLLLQAFIYLAVYSSIQGKLMLSTMAVKSFSELKVAADRFQVISSVSDSLPG